MSKNRSKTIIKCGWVFILTNFLLSIFSFVVGLLSNSIAIVSDAIHSLVDSISGVLVIITEKIAAMKKYAAKRQKIERATTIIIALIIIWAGIHIIVESFEKIFTPDEVDYTWPTILVIIACIVAKFILAMYLKRTGRKIKSNVIMASGAETMNDCWISVAVLVSAIIYLIWQVDIEAYVSLAIAIVIIKIGFEFIFPRFSRHHHHHLEQDASHGTIKP